MSSVLTPDHAAAARAVAAALADVVKGFDPSQPRDDQGRFASDGGGGGGESRSTWKEGDRRYSLAVPESVKDIPSLSDSEIQSIKSYTTGGYSDLNSALRNGYELTGDQKEIADNLTAAIDKAGTLSEPVTVFRGITTGGFMGGRADAVAQEYADRIGETVTLPGFQSASFYTEPVMDASSTGRPGTGVVFEIVTDRGLYVTPHSNFDDEAEFLLGEGWNYKITGVEMGATFEAGDYANEHKRNIIKLEVVGNGK